MIEHYFSRTSVLTRLRHGLLGPYLDELATALHQQGYARDSIRHYLRACDQFGRWLTHQGYTTQEVDEALVERYLRGLPRRPLGRQPQLAEGLPHLLQLLRQCGVITLPPAPSPATADDHWLRRYQDYLAHVLGAAVTTQQNSLPIAKRLLDAYSQAGHVEWDAIPAQAITAFVCQEATPRPGGGRKGLTAAVGGFLRFLVFCGELRPGVEAAVPQLRQWPHASLPQCLTAAQIEQVLATCTGSAPYHLRDQAILLLLARLGLRAHEVVTLRFDDIAWRQGQLRLLPGKTHHERLLPLSHEVGEAIVRYLRQGRPTSTSRRVLLTCRAPFRPFAGASAITQIAQRAMRRASLPDAPLVGAHIFRHSAASQMVNRGASFKDVADVLGHHSLQTTGIYAKLDLEALAAVALPWLGDAS
jgi:integrase/recombinase XerD